MKTMVERIEGWSEGGREGESEGGRIERAIRIRRRGREGGRKRQKREMKETISTLQDKAMHSV